MSFIKLCVACAFCVFVFIHSHAQEGFQNAQTIKLLPGELWWGGTTMHGRQMPLGNQAYTLNQYANNESNQAQPLLISNKGRYIWSNSPLNININNGSINVSSFNSKLEFGQSGESLKGAYSFVNRKFFPGSGKIPDSLLFTNPQYNTWIELQYNQNEQDILKYAQAIIDNGFPPGVLMIDDTWQTNYGTWEFDPGKFTNPKAMIEKLHSLGFKIMLWVCPFISADSRIYRKLAAEKLLMFSDKEKTKPAIVKWWNGYSALIDLSNPDGMSWYVGELKNLQEKYGVDGFKLDAGDAFFYENTYSYKDILPNDHTELHATVGLQFPLNEYRACWKMAGQPLAQRLQDKEHNWDDLRALIPDMTLQGLLGYAYGCPDMIGGGSFGSFLGDYKIDEELIVRAAQLHALMPMMQFSIAPWRVLSKENLAMCKQAAWLHLQFGPEILKIAKQSALSGEPIVRHMEYEFPNQGFATTKDQFMLGPDILVAPVLNKGERSRMVKFPKGKWKADDKVYSGPAEVNVSAPLGKLLWFRKVER
jgi:alpha-glucosidase (family GH31 glycosyl hydrolase)